VSVTEKSLRGRKPILFGARRLIPESEFSG
jgi:hypothetical protein